MFVQKIVECYPAYKYVWTKDSFENIFLSDRPGGAASHADDPFPTDLMALLNLGLNILPWHGWIALHQKNKQEREVARSHGPLDSVKFQNQEPKNDTIDKNVE